MISTRGVAARLNAPRPALVETAGGGEPRVVNRELVTVVREEWRVVDRWWTDDPVDRRYFEVVLESGRNVCVYHDGERPCAGQRHGARRVYAGSMSNPGRPRTWAP